MIGSPKITIVVPVMNEEESIPHFLTEFKDRTKSIDADFDFLFVDDGSTDRTVDIL